MANNIYSSDTCFRLCCSSALLCHTGQPISNYLHSNHLQTLAACLSAACHIWDRLDGAIMQILIKRCLMCSLHSMLQGWGLECLTFVCMLYRVTTAQLPPRICLLKPFVALQSATLGTLSCILSAWLQHCRRPISAAQQTLTTWHEWARRARRCSSSPARDAMASHRHILLLSIGQLLLTSLKDAL